MKKINLFYLILLITALGVNSSYSHLTTLKVKDISNEKELLEFKFEIEQWIKMNLTQRLEGLKKSPNELPQSKLHLIFAPNRKALITGLNPTDGQLSSDCPFDNPKNFIPPYADLKNFSFYLYPNIMPYVHDHLMLVAKKDNSRFQETSSHLTQDSFPLFLDDIFKIKKTFLNSTFFFNHYAGNSLEHLHLHFTTIDSYLENKIHFLISQIQKEVIISPLWFDVAPCLKGFIIWNKDQEMAKNQIKTLIDKIRKKDLLYNLFILRETDLKWQSPIVVIIPRKLSNKKFPHEKTMNNLNVPPSLSSFDLLEGKVIYNNEEKIKDHIKQIDDSILEMCQETILQSPSNLL